MLIGNGWDIHKHSSSEAMYLGGVKFQEDGLSELRYLIFLNQSD